MHWSIRATPAQEASLRLRCEDQEQVRAFQREEHKERSSGRWRTWEEKVSWGGSPGSHRKGLVCREELAVTAELNPSSLCSWMTLENSCCLFMPQVHHPRNGITAVLPLKGSCSED